MAVVRQSEGRAQWEQGQRARKQLWGGWWQWLHTVNVLTAPRGVCQSG